MKTLIAAAAFLLFAGPAWADIPPGPPPRREPGPPPTSPAPARKACGLGMGLVVFGLGVAVAWRLSKPRPADQPA